METIQEASAARYVFSGLRTIGEFCAIPFRDRPADSTVQNGINGKE